MRQEILSTVKEGVLDVLGLYVALLVAPFLVAKQFVMGASSASLEHERTDLR